MSLVKLDRQEAFNRAWTGLKNQAFRKATTVEMGGACVFLTLTGDRCAWGHVDPVGTRTILGGIGTATISNTANLAIYLDSADVAWASELQECHDSSASPQNMRHLLVQFALKEGLEVPDVQVSVVRDAIDGAAVLDKDARDRILLAVLVAL